MPGGTEVEARTSSIGITNNLYGEGHIPYTDTPDGGTLGIYVTKARSRREMFAFLAMMALGRWKSNDQVEISPDEIGDDAHPVVAPEVPMRDRRRVVQARAEGRGRRFIPAH